MQTEKVTAGLMIAFSMPYWMIWDSGLCNLSRTSSLDLVQEHPNKGISQCVQVPD